GFFGAREARGGRMVGMLQPESAPGLRRLQGGFRSSGTLLAIGERRSCLRLDQGESGADLSALAVQRGSAFRLRNRASWVSRIEQRIREQRGGPEPGGAGGVLRLRFAKVDRGVLRVACEEQRLAQQLREMRVQVR